jgi:hypothetical protein
MVSDSEFRERLGPLGDSPQDPNAGPRYQPAGLIAALVVLVLLLWGSGIALILHFERICPPVYDQPSGHLYYFSDHRPGNPHIVYHTAKEHYTAYAALSVSLLSTKAVAFYALSRRKPAPPASS